MGSADGRRGAGSQRRDGTVMPLPPPPSSRPGQGLALARPPGASPRKKHSHGPSADFMEAWSRAVVRTLPAPPGVRPGRPAVAPLPAPPRPAADAPAAPAGPAASGKRTRRGTDRRRAAKLSRRDQDEVVVIFDDDDEDDRGRSNGGTSTSEPSDPRRRSPRKSNTNTSAVVTVDLTDSAPEPVAKTPAAPAAPSAPAPRRKENKTIIENVARRAKLSRPPPPFVSSHRTHRRRWRGAFRARCRQTQRHAESQRRRRDHARDLRVAGPTQAPAGARSRPHFAEQRDVRGLRGGRRGRCSSRASPRRSRRRTRELRNES